MNTIWILVLVAVYSNGDARTFLNFPQKPEYNAQKSCNESGQALANQLQTKLGTQNATVYFYCDGVSRSEIAKSLNGV